MSHHPSEKDMAALAEVLLEKLEQKQIKPNVECIDKKIKMANTKMYIKMTTCLLRYPATKTIGQVWQEGTLVPIQAVEGQSDMARVLVQVKRNGGKKGIPFLVYNIVFAMMLEVLSMDTQVQGFKFHENDFQLFDSRWIEILSSDVTRPTHLLKKGMTHTGTKKGALGSWKYIQKWAETWYFVLTHRAYQSFELWEAGEESPMSSPVPRPKPKSKKRENPMMINLKHLILLACGHLTNTPNEFEDMGRSMIRSNEEFSVDKGGSVPASQTMQPFQLVTTIQTTRSALASAGPVPLMIGMESTPSRPSLKQAVKQSAKHLHPQITVNCKEWFKDMLNLLEKAGQCKEVPSGRANTILWATTIHDMSMNMVAMTAPSRGHPPGPIPDSAFVEVAVVLNMKPESGFTALVERKLPKQFKKYIGNTSPEPIPGLDVEAHAKAVFLCFLQHVQFHFSLGKVLFLITKNPWKNTLSNGNFDGSLEEFQEKHQCLNWCQWFGLETLSDSDSD
ncbi:hypothetical protein EDD18DRAFT_1098823 [Armillaria luteobubalina]|uniref:Alpha-type protein kinase domain-containing protein n=1 Tax=Armillaria luteobubalina TaxID=153913 RepID=A0AA39QNB9_9AGAR|nr:hypothetical protein EDD18DRAFT_1098823 [Armillaria luteobubalina]